MSNPYSAYRQSQVLTASPLRLIHLAYEGALTAIADAQSCQAPEHLPRKKAAIGKAQLILGELRRTLDFANGGDIAVQLARLYDFMQTELRKAVFSPTPQPLQTVQGLLTTLNEAWSAVSAETAATPSEMPSPYGYDADQLTPARAAYSL